MAVDTIDIKDTYTYIGDVIEDFKAVEFREALDQIGAKFAEKTTQNFLSESSPSGSPWEPLSPFTIAKKGHDTILVDSTTMRKSVVLRDAPHHIERIGKNAAGEEEIVYGTDVAYAVFHQEGTARMPQREFLGLEEKDADDIAEIVADHIVEKLKQ